MDRTTRTGQSSGHEPDAGAPVIEQLAGVATASGGPAGGWRVERATGTAQQLHDAPVGFERRLVRVHHLRDTAVVLGSTQAETLVDRVAAGRAGVTVARRRSGGGAVHLSPAGAVWIDLVVPADDPLWNDDVGRASWWLGDCWAAALGPAGTAEPTVHRGAVSDRVLARIACFAALGPGEVEIAGRKVVGISQRRTRLGARFQCVAYTHWDPEPMLALLRMETDASRVEHALRTAAGPVPARSGEGGRSDGWSVVEDLLRSLP